MIFCTYISMNNAYFFSHNAFFIKTLYHTFKVRKRTTNDLHTTTAEQFLKLLDFWEMFAQ